MLNNKCESLNYGILSGIISLVLAMAYWYYALRIGYTSALGMGSLGKIKCYVLFVAIFVIVFVTLFLALKKINLHLCENVGFKYFCMVLFAVIIVAAVLNIAYDEKLFVYWLTLVFMFVTSVFYVLGLKYNPKSYTDIISAILILLMAAIYGVAVATPNTVAPVYSDSSNMVHHTSAYIDSIYNVYNHVGFTGSITDQYGHYALFFWIPLKIFGFNTKVIATILGIISSATFILAMISFCRIVKQRIVRYLVILLGGIYSICFTIQYTYWQDYPQRFAFPMITLFLATCYKENENKIRKNIIGTIIMSMAVLWNFETGIVCCLAWAAFKTTDYLQNYRLSFKNVVIVVVKVAIVVIVPIFAMLTIVSLYNVSCQENPLSISQVIGSMLNSDYILLIQYANLNWGNCLYLHKIIAFLICFGWGILHNTLFGIQGNNRKANYAVITSILGLGIMTYYINESNGTAENITNLYYIICLGLLMSSLYDVPKWGDIKNFSISQCAKMIVGIYAVLMLALCGTNWANVYNEFKNKVEEGAYDYGRFKTLAEQIEQYIPKDTWAIGEGTSALYMELGWNKGTREFGYTEADEINEHDTLLASSRVSHLVSRKYKLIKEFVYNEDFSFKYYKRRTNIYNGNAELEVYEDYVLTDECEYTGDLYYDETGGAWMGNLLDVCFLLEEPVESDLLLTTYGYSTSADKEIRIYINDEYLGNLEREDDTLNITNRYIVIHKEMMPESGYVTISIQTATDESVLDDSGNEFKLGMNLENIYIKELND